MPFAVNLMEYERGWGPRCDETVYFNDIDKADAYVKRFNSSNTETVVPDWYMIATEPTFVRTIPSNKVARDEFVDEGAGI